MLQRSLELWMQSSKNDAGLKEFASNEFYQGICKGGCQFSACISTLYAWPAAIFPRLRCTKGIGSSPIAQPRNVESSQVVHGGGCAAYAVGSMLHQSTSNSFGSSRPSIQAFTPWAKSSGNCRSQPCAASFTTMARFLSCFSFRILPIFFVLSTSS
jgi:hypothetical protein